jgi:hypothetical protein
MGVTNLGRAFKADQWHNGPQIALKVKKALFPESWSEGSRSDQDVSAAADTSTTDPTTTLYPITPMAEAFNDNHWPLLLSLLQSGTGTRYNTSLSEVVRYYSMVQVALENIMVPLQINYLTSVFDWSEVAPFSNTVPPAVWGLAELFDATDVGVADTWKPLYERLSSKVLPPNVSASIMEAGFPYLADPNGHVLRLPITGAAEYAINEWDISTFITNIEDKLNYLESVLINCHNTLASFLPWRVGSPIAMFKGYDPVYEEVDYNSGLTQYDTFGDTGDPVESRVILCGTGTTVGDSILYYHRGGTPIAKAVLNTTIMELISGTDDEFMVISGARQSGVSFLDDDLNLITYDGDPPISTTAARYRLYYPNRFMTDSGEHNGGRGTRGFLPSLLSKEEVIRTTKHYTDWLFGNDAMKNVIGLTGGSSVRVIHAAIAEQWANRRR